MDRPVLDHEGPWTEDAYLDLRRSGPGPVRCGMRVELVDGALVVGPGSGPGRACVVDRVREVVAAALPDGLRVVGPVPLRLGPDCVLTPDLVVTRTPPTPLPADPAAGPVAAEPRPDAPPDAPAAVPLPGPVDAEPPAVLDAADALMVLEVVGAEHGAVDRSFKPQLYARSHIPYSLLVDHDGPFAVAQMIIGGRYHEYAYAAAGEVLRVQEPFALDLDLSRDLRPDAAAEPRGA